MTNDSPGEIARLVSPMTNGAGVATTMLSAATAHAAAGVPVFPCKPGAKRPAVTRGHLAASADRRRVQSWWSQRPHAGFV